LRIALVLATLLPALALPQASSLPELTPGMNAQITVPLQVAVSGPGITQTLAGMAVNLTFTIANSGAQNDRYTLTPGSNVAWGDLRGATSPVSLKAGASMRVVIPVTVPPGTATGTTGLFYVKAVSLTSAAITDTGTASVTVAAMAITPPPADGRAGVAYGPLQLTASGARPPYKWTATGLPGGIQLSTNGILSGVPVAAGVFQTAITVTDSTASVRTSQVYAMTIAMAASVAITSRSLRPGAVGAAYGPVTMNAAGGTAPYVWGAVDLPPGLSMDPKNGAIGGTPIATGQYSVLITATDSTGVATSKNFAVTIAAGTPRR